MKIKSNKEYAVASTDILGLNNKEMRQMHELKTTIKEVLDSHKPDSKEKKYINDDELKLMYAIISVFTNDFSQTQNSAFDDFLKTEEEAEKSCAIVTEQEPKETLIKGGQGMFENYTPGESANY